MRHLSALSWALCLILCSAMIHAAGPGFITYQGSLATQDGDLPASGAYDMEFKLWGSTLGGDMHWMEAHTGVNAVVVINGVFSVNLGSITPFPENLFTLVPHLWLEVAVDKNGDGLSEDEVYSPDLPPSNGSKTYVSIWAQELKKGGHGYGPETTHNRTDYQPSA